VQADVQARAGGTVYQGALAGVAGRTAGGADRRRARVSSLCHQSDSAMPLREHLAKAGIGTGLHIRSGSSAAGAGEKRRIEGSLKATMRLQQSS